MKMFVLMQCAFFSSEQAADLTDDIFAWSNVEIDIRLYKFLSMLTLGDFERKQRIDVKQS